MNYAQTGKNFLIESVSAYSGIPRSTLAWKFFVYQYSINNSLIKINTENNLKMLGKLAKDFNYLREYEN